MNLSIPRLWAIEYFTKRNNRSPVDEFIEEQTKEDQGKIYNHLRLLREFGTELQMPHAKPLKGHKPLWELRPFPHRLIYFACTGRRFILLHGFTKTGRKTDPKEILIAERRMKQQLERENDNQHSL